MTSRPFCTVTAQAKQAPSGAGIIARSRSFVSGFLLASAAGFYITFFQMQGYIDEMKTSVEQIARRQDIIERKLLELSM